ncbi:MAG: DNA-protecting protein DprA [Phycisphaerales bacterium]|nr:MAG: DNA-protecting protein DprA [Phycisphaerales bacterium]
MNNGMDRLLPMLRLTLTPGLGPVLIGRAVEAFGSADAALGASETSWKRVRGIGVEKARRIAAGVRETERAAQHELALAQRLGVAIVAKGEASYPPLLAPLEDAPTLLYVRGSLDPAQDAHAVAIVGSRACTPYGVEQSERFASMLAQCGMVIVSGGARGIDTAAHRATLRVRGRTVVVSGCGLAHCYPPENAELFDAVVEGGGAVISELPLSAAPSPDNFPARNRVISGMSLGVLVVEASKRSGALITARAAAEEHGREVMAVPGRVDSPSSEGSNELIKSGGAALVMHHADVLDQLEAPARYLHQGVHEHRYGATPRDGEGAVIEPAPVVGVGELALTERQRALLDALAEPRSVDELVRLTGAEASSLLTDATTLEMRRLIVREGGRLRRRPRG